MGSFATCCRSGYEDNCTSNGNITGISEVDGKS